MTTMASMDERHQGIASPRGQKLVRGMRRDRQSWITRLAARLSHTRRGPASVDQTHGSETDSRGSGDSDRGCPTDASAEACDKRFHWNDEKAVELKSLARRQTCPTSAATNPTGHDEKAVEFKSLTRSQTYQASAATNLTDPFQMAWW